MKLYTEEQIKEAMFLYRAPIRPLVQQVLEQLAPIELPIDEEIESNAKTYADHQFKGMSDKSSTFECINDFKAGAQWVIEQILNQNTK